MVVAQPTHPSPATPIRGDDNYVQPVGRLDLEPLFAPSTRRVIACQRLGHQSLVALLECRLQKVVHDLVVPGHDPWGQRVGWYQTRQGFPSFSVRKIYQGLSFGLEDIEEIES